MAEEKKARTLTGKVVSDKMDKSIVVKIERRERHPAQEERVGRLLVGPLPHTRIAPRFAKFGHDDGIEQPPPHRGTSRTGMGSPRGGRATSRSGDVDRSAWRLGWRRLGWSASKCSADTTTTASCPRTVTRWGPTARARRTTSLKRAFASSSFHARGRPRGPPRDRRVRCRGDTPDLLAD